MFSYILIGFITGIVYIETLYRVVKKGKNLVYVSMPLRITFFAFTLSIFIEDLFTSLYLIGGFFAGFLLNLFARGWLLNGLSKLSRTNL